MASGSKGVTKCRQVRVIAVKNRRGVKRQRREPRAHAIWVGRRSPGPSLLRCLPSQSLSRLPSIPRFPALPAFKVDQPRQVRATAFGQHLRRQVNFTHGPRLGSRQSQATRFRGRGHRAPLCTVRARLPPGRRWCSIEMRRTPQDLAPQHSKDRARHVALSGRHLTRAISAHHPLQIV